MAGLTSTGFEAKTTAEILGDVEARLRDGLGDDLDVSAEQPLGQINAIYATHLREAWEALGALYAARVPDGASGAPLDGLAEITADERREATRGTVTLTVTLGAGITLGAGAIAAVTGQPTNRWVTTASATNASGAQAPVEVEAEAETAGLIRANAGTIRVIATPVSGWVGVTNAESATPGTDDETDPRLRRRRASAIRTGGSSPLDAVYRALRDLEGVTQVQVFENTSRFVDADGRPPKSIDAIVVGGDDQAIAEALWAAKSAGIETWAPASGGVECTVLDSRGASHTVRFSRPADVNVYVNAVVEVDRAIYPTTASLLAVVGPAVDALGDLQAIGAPTRIELVRSTIFRLAGVIDVPSVGLGRSALVTYPSNLIVGRRELADLDTSRVAVAFP